MIEKLPKETIKAIHAKLDKEIKRNIKEKLEKWVIHLSVTVRAEGKVMTGEEAKGALQKYADIKDETLKYITTIKKDNESFDVVFTLEYLLPQIEETVAQNG